MHPPACRGTPAGRGRVDKGGTPLVGALAGVVDERRQACGQARKYVGSVISGAMPHMPGWAACRSGAVVCSFGTVTGHPVTHQPGITRSSLAWGCLMALIRVVSVVSSRHPQYQAGHAERRMRAGRVGCIG